MFKLYQSNINFGFFRKGILTVHQAFARYTRYSHSAPGVHTVHQGFSQCTRYSHGSPGILTVLQVFSLCTRYSHSAHGITTMHRVFSDCTGFNWWTIVASLSYSNSWCKYLAVRQLRHPGLEKITAECNGFSIEYKCTYFLCKYLISVLRWASNEIFTLL